MARRKTTVEEFDPARVRPLPDQPRKRFGGIHALARSIAAIGQQTPGIVTLVEDDPAFDAQLIDGERRLRACRLAGVPFRAEVRSPAAAEQFLLASFAANFGRQDHDAIEIAELLGKRHAAGVAITTLAVAAQRSTAWVAHHLNLLKLCPEVRQMMVRPDRDDDEDDGDEQPLTFQLAQLLVPLSAGEQVRTARAILRKGMGLAEARRYVLARRHKLGDRTAYAAVEKRGRARTLLALANAARTFSHKSGVYTDMPGSEFNALRRMATPEQFAQVVEAMEEVEQQARDIREVLLEEAAKDEKRQQLAA